MGATRRENYLAIVIILGIVATLGLRLWAAHHADAIYGPRLVTANRQAAYVVMNGHLYHLDRSGTVQDAVSLDAIGFSDAPCDMQAIEDGRLLIGHRDTRTIHACDANLSSCLPFYALPVADGREGAGRTAETIGFDFFFEAATRRLFLVDAVRREFAIIDMAGGSRTLVLDREDLYLPGAIWVDHRGTARIADAEAQRVAGVLTESSRFKAFYNDYPGRTAFARGENHFPIDLVQGPHKNWWVLNAGPNLVRADLVRYDPDGNPLRRIALPDDAEPAALALFGERLLVAAPAQFRLLSVDVEDEHVERFGGEPFTDEGEYFKQRAVAYRSISGLAMICLVLFVLFCAVLTWKAFFMKRVTGDDTAGSSPSSRR